MDPAQHDGAWRGLGLRQIADVGFADLVEFHERASQAVLPACGVQVQFAFIGGWHTFDHTLVDFFYIDHMLEVGRDRLRRRGLPVHQRGPALRPGEPRLRAGGGD
jgi:hypothetical protein